MSEQAIAAVTMLDNIVAQVSLSRQDHMRAQASVSIIKKFIDEAAATEVKLTELEDSIIDSGDTC